MATFIFNVAPYVDLDYVEGGYVDDSFLLQGRSAEFRETGGLMAFTGEFVLSTVVATDIKSNRNIFPQPLSYTSLITDAAVNAQFRQFISLTPFQLSPFDVSTSASRGFQALRNTFLLRGFDARLGPFLPFFTEGFGFTRDISDQSRDFENLRTSYGGSDNTSPSFLRPQYVRWNSISKSRDLGSVRSLDAQIRGKLGSEVGSSSLFFRLEAIEPAKIRITKLPAANRFDDRAISVGLLDSNRKAIDIDEDGFARRPLSDSERLAITSGGAQQVFQFLPPGVYFFTVSSTQWRTADYGIEIVIGGTASLSGVTVFSLDPSGRIAQSFLEGIAEYTQEATGNLFDVQELAGTADGRLDPTLTLSVTSPFNIN